MMTYQVCSVRMKTWGPDPQPRPQLSHLQMLGVKTQGPGESSGSASLLLGTF